MSIEKLKSGLQHVAVGTENPEELDNKCNSGHLFMAKKGSDTRLTLKVTVSKQMSVMLLYHYSPAITLWL